MPSQCEQSRSPVLTGPTSQPGRKTRARVLVVTCLFLDLPPRAPVPSSFHGPVGISNLSQRVVRRHETSFESILASMRPPPSLLWSHPFHGALSLSPSVSRKTPSLDAPSWSSICSHPQDPLPRQESPDWRPGIFILCSDSFLQHGKTLAIHLQPLTENRPALCLLSPKCMNQGSLPPGHVTSRNSPVMVSCYRLYNEACLPPTSQHQSILGRTRRDTTRACSCTDRCLNKPISTASSVASSFLPIRAATSCAVMGYFVGYVPRYVPTSLSTEELGYP